MKEATQAFYHQSQLIQGWFETNLETIRSLQKEMEQVTTFMRTLQQLIEGPETPDADGNGPIDALFDKLQGIEAKLDQLDRRL